MIQSDIFRILSEASEINSIVGNRIYPINLPCKEPVPAIVYTIESIDPLVTLNGEVGIDNGKIEIICWSKDYSQAHALAQAVRNAFSESGTFITTESMQDLQDEDTKTYGVVMNMNSLQ